MSRSDRRGAESTQLCEESRITAVSKVQEWEWALRSWAVCAQAVPRGLWGRSELSFLPPTVPPGIALPTLYHSCFYKGWTGPLQEGKILILVRSAPPFMLYWLTFHLSGNQLNYSLGFYFSCLYQPCRLKIRPTLSTFIWENMQAIQVGLRKESYKAEGDKRHFWINHFTGGRLLEQSTGKC